MTQFKDAWGYPIKVGQRVWYVRSSGRYSNAGPYKVVKITDKSVTIQSPGSDGKWPYHWVGNKMIIVNSFYNMTIHPEDINL